MFYKIIKIIEVIMLILILSKAIKSSLRNKIIFLNGKMKTKK